MTMAVYTALGVQPIFWNQMLRDIRVSQLDLTNGGTVKLGGTAVGCIVFIPFAKKYGRRSAYIFSTALVAAGVWWSAYMKTTAEVYLTNFVIGLAGAVNQAAVQMSRGTANGIYFIASKTGASLAPMMAGAHAAKAGYRTSYVSLAVCLTLITLLFVGTLEETKFVSRDGDGDGKRVGLAETASASEIDRIVAPLRAPFPRYLRLELITETKESLLSIFREPLQTWWWPHVLFASVVYGMGICWFVVVGTVTAIRFVKEPYGFDSAQVGYMFGASAVGSVLGCLYGGFLTDKSIQWLARRNGGVFEPEMRFYLLPLPAVTLSVGLVIFGATTDQGAHWFFPALGIVIFSFGFGATADIVCTVVIDSYPDRLAAKDVPKPPETLR
ncbi:major facilitator superfamily transporter [Ophiocordyceps camponoti-floridani]|uniref:Major facilitator superfamily transporter n=1 Tax=Ophiocordyceps camponoti-floridani TaxID=2030778 RepID=A0A8H4QB30_9HYPO|nr:major facilitator superfamily transporter [Ophiocordyceps camponoti-floridani]